MQALVTGGAGFIGSHLVTALLAQGNKVRVLDNFSTGKQQNLAGLDVEIVLGDIGDEAVVQTAVANCHTIYHLAALVSVPESIKKPSLNQHINISGTFNILEAARLAGVKRVVYSSSAAVYGNLAHLPARETEPPTPLSPYGAAKWMNEIMAQSYHTAFGLESIGLRYMNVFGPRQDPASPYSGVLSVFCRAAISGSPITIYGDGSQTRDFVFVADVVQANLLAAQLPTSKLPAKPVFNIGRGQQTSLNQIVATLREVTDHPLPINYAPDRPGDIKHSLADISQAQTILGFQPQTSVLEGLQATLAWFKQ